MGLTATSTRSTRKTPSSSSPARSSNNIFKSEKELDKEIEVEVLRKLDHPHIIKVEDIIYDDKAGRLYIVMEQGKKNIAEIIEDKRKIGTCFDEDTIRMYMKQLIEAVGHMHEVGYFHRDLKPENMILVNDKEIRLIDFGTCMSMKRIHDKNPFSDYVSTRWYRAPECILKFPKYNEKVDVFAIGCIMAELYRMAPAFCGKNAVDQLRIYCNALGSPKKDDWPEAYVKAQEIGFVFPQLPQRSIAYKVDNASEEAIDLMDQMLSLNPKYRPDIKSILEHPYFTNAPEPVDVINPFTSPVGTPERADSFSGHNFFSEPVFGRENVPNFGSSNHDDSPGKQMEISYSPLGRGCLMGAGESSHKKTKSLLNDGDGLPIEPKFSYSHGKNTQYKKPKSDYAYDNKESGFGGFNISEIEDFKNQKQRTKSHAFMDDELTNTDTAFDVFGERGRRNQEEDLPSFGSLVYDANQQSNRSKSQNVSELTKMAGKSSSKPHSANKEPEYQTKASNDPSISSRYKGKDKFGAMPKDAPGFGSFGAPNAFSSGGKLSSNHQEKVKKPSICDDDELLFAVAQNEPK